MPDQLPLCQRQLKNFDAETFLRADWQRQPRLIRRAIEGVNSLPTVNQLAGLAMEEEVESRLICHYPESDEWALRQGPFAEVELRSLPASHWTLLVQAVDHYLPEVASLLDCFRFIPRWQIDDIMVSVAATGGGVGPHFDRYDVFLLQGSGRREWKIGQRCDHASALQPGRPLNLLAEFETEQTLILEPGDMLYLPPGVAHWGTALDDHCSTYSIGFRSPAVADLLADFSHTLQQSGEPVRFCEGLGERADSGDCPALISVDTLVELRAVLSASLDDDQQLLRWFGRWASEHKYADMTLGEDLDLLDDTAVEKALAVIGNDDTAMGYRDGGMRFFYAESGRGESLLFCNGRSFTVATASEAVAESLAALCNQREIAVSALRCWLDSEDNRRVLVKLLRSGALII